MSIIFLLPLISVVFGIRVIPDKVEASIGDSVTLTCDTEGTTQFEPTWSMPSSDAQATPQSDKRVLVIDSVTVASNGTYTCTILSFKNGRMDQEKASSALIIKAESPGPPQDLRVILFGKSTSGSGLGFVTLTWERGFMGYAPVLYYRLEYKTEDSVWMRWKTDAPADSTEFKVDGLKFEESYSFRVIQSNKAGNSPPSEHTSLIFLQHEGSPSIRPVIEKVEPFNGTSVRVIWSMPDTGENIGQWNVEYRAEGEKKSFKSVSVDRGDGNTPTIISVIGDLEEAKLYDFRMFCRNERGRGPSSIGVQAATLETAPSASPRNVRVDHVPDDSIVQVSWIAPPPRDTNGKLTGYQIKIYFSDPESSSTKSSTTASKEYTAQGQDNFLEVPMSEDKLPIWVAVAAKTSVGYGPFSDFVTIYKADEQPVANGTAVDELIALFKQPWLIAVLAAIVLTIIVMTVIIICRQKKIRRRKLMQQVHASHGYKPYPPGSVTSSQNGGSQFRMGRDDGPQYERIPDSRTTTPHGSNRSYDGRMFDNRSTPNSYHMDNRMQPGYCPSNISVDSHRYSSQQSSMDDLASTGLSATYSLPHARDQGYKVVNPTSNDRGPEVPVAKVAPKAKERDPNAAKPVYGNIAVRDYLRKKQQDGGHSELSGKDSGRGSTDAA